TSLKIRQDLCCCISRSASSPRSAKSMPSASAFEPVVPRYARSTPPRTRLRKSERAGPRPKQGRRESARLETARVRRARLIAVDKRPVLVPSHAQRPEADSIETKSGGYFVEHPQSSRATRRWT